MTPAQQRKLLKSHLKKAVNILRPPKKLTISEWADEYRRLDSQSSAEAGRWYTSRAEYQRGIMDACSNPENKEVVVMAGAQLGKTEALLNIIGYFIHNEPAPILCVQPTLDMAQSFSKDRVTAGLLKSTPCLQDKVKDARSRDSGNTTLHKTFSGGALTMAGSNSPSSLASRPIRVLLLDEVDRYPQSAGSEGSPTLLAKKRTATFWNRKIIQVSTPTNKGASAIEDAFELSDKRYYEVPCRHCDEYQVLRWANVKWTKDDPDSAAYCCEHCGTLWTDSDRRWAIRNGEWQATEEFTGIAGFHISGLYSPWTPLADGVKDFLAARKNPEHLKVWTNVYLAETWEDAGEQIECMDLAERREPTEKIPEEVLLLTCGVDVQDNRLELSLIGWQQNDCSIVLDHITLFGDPSTPQLWQSLDTHLLRNYDTEDGRQLPISATCIDSGGHFTNSVYQYCKKNYGRRIFAIKGVGGDGKAIAGKPSKNNIAKCPLFPIGVDTVKDLVFARLKIEKDSPGHVRFSDKLTNDYFEMLTAEKAMIKFHKGFKKRVYVKIRPRNEALDCMVYSVAAYAIINVNVNTLAEKKHKKREVIEQKPMNKPIQRPHKGGFVSNWR
jgi:phage terminase large subunit GpA-like protein